MPRQTVLPYVFFPDRVVYVRMVLFSWYVVPLYHIHTHVYREVRSTVFLLHLRSKG